VIAGAGELHLEVCLKDLETKYAGVAIRVGEPVVRYRETVSQKSKVCLAKTVNKLNRVYFSAEPLGERFCRDVDEKRLFVNQDGKERASYLHAEHGFELTEAKKIWCFGPDHFGTNLLVDKTKGVGGLKEVTDVVCAGFQWGASEGVLCGEALRGE